MSNPTNPLLVSRRTETVVLYPGDYQDRIDQLVVEISQAEEEATSDVRKRKVAEKLAQELDDLRVPEKIPGAVIITVGEIPDRREQLILDEHPPRKSNPVDEASGYNRDTFPNALIQASLVSPEVTPEQFDEWAGTVSPANWNKVWAAVQRVNHGQVDVPKSSAVLALRVRRAVASRQQRSSG